MKQVTSEPRGDDFEDRTAGSSLSHFNSNKYNTCIYTVHAHEKQIERVSTSCKSLYPDLDEAH